MTQEDKQLLLKDLCARLPYKVIIKSIGENKIIGLWDLRDIDNLPLPYLRPMSSMTEEENKKLDEIWLKHTIVEGADYLNSIHVDYRGLIKKGLAIEVNKENNPYNSLEL